MTDGWAGLVGKRIRGRKAGPACSIASLGRRSHYTTENRTAWIRLPLTHTYFGPHGDRRQSDAAVCTALNQSYARRAPLSPQTTIGMHAAAALRRKAACVVSDTSEDQRGGAPPFGTICHAMCRRRPAEFRKNTGCGGACCNCPPRPRAFLFL